MLKLVKLVSPTLVQNGLNTKNIYRFTNDTCFDWALMTTTEDFTLLDDVCVSSHYMWALFLVSNELLLTVCCHLQQHLKTGSVVPFWTWGVMSSLHVSSRTLLQLPNTEPKEDTSLILGWEKKRIFVTTMYNFKKLWKSGTWFCSQSSGRILLQRTQGQLLVSVVLEEMIQALKRITIHPRRHKSQGLVAFKSYFIWI